MSPKARLVASAISSFVAILLFKVWLSKLGIPGFDLLMFAPLRNIITIFATVGVINAFNLIDGLNGLASYGRFLLRSHYRLLPCGLAICKLPFFLVLIIAAVLGFMVLNFPMGKIFWEMVALILWATCLSGLRLFSLTALERSVPFAILLVFLPVADTSLAIWRRWQLGNPAVRPDRLHFHQLVMRFLEIRFFGREKREIANPLATLILFPDFYAPKFLVYCLG